MLIYIINVMQDLFKLLGLLKQFLARLRINIVVVIDLMHKAILGDFHYVYNLVTRINVYSILQSLVCDVSVQLFTGKQKRLAKNYSYTKSL